MQPSANPNIIPLIRHVCLSLKSFAASKQVQVYFTNSKTLVSFDHQPCEIIHCLSQLLCRIISYLPTNSKVTVTASVINTPVKTSFQISIHNTGINLSKIKEIINNLKPVVSVEPSMAKETTFNIHIPIPAKGEEVIAQRPIKVNGENLPVFFEEVRKSLQGYFSRTNHYLENFKYLNPRKAAFLKKINECILQNLDNENFDASALSREIAMSRTQLFRKLKTVISQSPASYIKSMRLQRAKVLLQGGELSVSEVAYKTGFKTPSHFTKVFTEKFGIRPSVISTSKVHATNE